MVQHMFTLESWITMFGGTCRLQLSLRLSRKHDQPFDKYGALPRIDFMRFLALLMDEQSLGAI